MSEIVQNTLAIALCAAATCYVLWRTWRALAGKKSSSGCGDCSSSQALGAPKVKQLTLIEPQSTQSRPRR